VNRSELDVELNEYLFDILDQAKNGIVITNPNLEDNVIVYVNKTFTDMFEYTKEEVIGKNSRFLHQNDREQKGLHLIVEAIKNKHWEIVEILYENDAKIISMNSNYGWEILSSAAQFNKLPLIKNIMKDTKLVKDTL